MTLFRRCQAGREFRVAVVSMKLSITREVGVLLGSHADVDLKSLGLAVQALLFIQEQLKEIISEHFNRHACVTRTETAVVFNRVTRHEISIVDSDVAPKSQERSKPPVRQRGKR